MKKGLLFFAFFLFGVSAFSQDYTPLLDNVNEWHFTTCYSGCLTDVYYTDGDTLVDGKNYKILDGFHYISRTFLLREEVANKRVFLNKVAPGHNEEFLLYDFSLQVGDIFNMFNPVSPFPEDGGFFEVDSIVERPLADGNQYRHFYFSPAPGNTISFDNAIWIEGVGSLSMINAPGGKPDINGVGHLSCFFKNTEIFYSNLDSIDACTPIHLKVEQFKLNKVVLSKAQLEDYCILNNAENIKTVVVYTLSGKKLVKIEGKGKSKLKVNLSNFQSGLYILLATGISGDSKSFKVIK